MGFFPVFWGEVDSSNQAHVMHSHLAPVLLKEARGAMVMPSRPGILHFEWQHSTSPYVISVGPHVFNIHDGTAKSVFLPTAQPARHSMS